MNRGNYSFAVDYYTDLVTFDSKFASFGPSVRAEDYLHYAQALEANHQLLLARSAYETSADLGNEAARTALERLKTDQQY